MVKETKTAKPRATRAKTAKAATAEAIIVMPEVKLNCLFAKCVAAGRCLGHSGYATSAFSDPSMALPALSKHG